MFEFPATLGDVPATCGRIGCHLRRCLREVALVRAQAIFLSPESPELPRLISRGNVSASEIGPLLGSSINKSQPKQLVGMHTRGTVYMDASISRDLLVMPGAHRYTAPPGQWMTHAPPKGNTWIRSTTIHWLSSRLPPLSGRMSKSCLTWQQVGASSHSMGSCNHDNRLCDDYITWDDWQSDSSTSCSTLRGTVMVHINQYDLWFSFYSMPICRKQFWIISLWYNVISIFN